MPGRNEARTLPKPAPPDPGARPGAAGAAPATGSGAAAGGPRRETAVLASGVGFSYPGRRALDGIGFEVGRGEIFGFLGPNGGGKSTLFKILATLLPLAEGEAEVLGHDLAAEPRAVRRELGVVFQSPSLDKHLTGRENLRHQGHLYGLSGSDLARRIEESLDRLGLHGRGDDRAGTLSGGLARRLEIAKALLHGPRLLLLDEPSTGLDPGARRDLAAVLGELAGSGVTVLLTTHFMEEGDRCDRLALLSRGHIVASGTPAELKRRVGGDVVTVAARDPESLARDLAAHPLARDGGILGEPRVADGAVRFERERAHELVARLAESFPGRIDAITVAQPTLEDVFLRETGESLYRGRAGREDLGEAVRDSTAGASPAGTAAGFEEAAR